MRCLYENSIVVKLEGRQSLAIVKKRQNLCRISESEVVKDQMVKMWQVEDSIKKSGSFRSREDLTVSEDGE